MKRLIVLVKDLMGDFLTEAVFCGIEDEDLFPRLIIRLHVFLFDLPFIFLPLSSICIRSWTT